MFYKHSSMVHESRPAVFGFSAALAALIAILCVSAALASEPIPAAVQPKTTKRAPAPIAIPRPTTGTLEVATNTDLTSRTCAMLRDAGFGSKAKFGFFVRRLDTGEILMDIDGSRALKPASCFKLFTTSCALFTLGPDYTWKTDIAANGKISNGVLRGDLVIIGHGDPTLGARFHPKKDSKDLTYQFRDWAAQLRKNGVTTSIRGDIVGDDDEFDDNFFGRGWYPDERAEWYCAEVSALSFNDNCIDISWTGARSEGDLALFTLNPPTRYCKINDLVKTVSKDKKDASLQYFREEKSNIIRAEGTIPARKNKYDYAAIHNPTLFTATIIKETLEKEEFKIGGEPRDIDDFTTKSMIREGLNILFTHESAPLSKVVEVINRNSQNLYAELLLRTLGRKVRGQGSFEAGCRALEDWLVREHIFRNGFCAIDGSGLSSLNRASARMLVNLLQFMFQSKYKDLFIETLPQGGVRGTLANRFKGNEAAKRVFAKTGYLGGVHSMAGFVQTEDGVWMAFAAILNDFEISEGDARNVLDSIILEIANVKAAPTPTHAPPANTKR